MMCLDPRRWGTLLALLYLTTTVGSLNILGMFPHPGISHFKFFHPIMRGLAEVGHSVDVVSPFPDKLPVPGYTDFRLPVDHLSDAIGFEQFEQKQAFPFLLSYAEFFFLHKLGKNACNITLNGEALTQILKRPPGYYDVIMMEHFNTDCLMGVAYQLQAPVIAMSSCALMPWHYERMGAPLIPSYISGHFQGQSQEMSFGGRLANWILVHSLNLFYNLYSVPATDTLVRKRFGGHVPSTGEMVKNTSLMLINQHYSMSGSRPLPPNVIEVGGVHIKPAKPLPADLQKLLDNAKQGAILISSQLRCTSLSTAKRDGLLRALARLDQQVLWKWENETLPNHPANLHFMKWLPQRDIMAHPNLKVFLTHGGLMGTTEAVSRGLPIVGMPIYGDQSLNIAALVQRGMAVHLDFHSLSEETVYSALTKALEPSYKRQAQIVASSFNKRPQKPLETAIWWVEHVARTKGAPLTQPRAVHLSRFVYYSLDVHLALGAALGLLIIIWLRFRRRKSATSLPLKPKKN